MYAVYIKRHFQRSLEKLTERDKTLKKVIESRVKALSDFPLHDSKLLHGRFLGKRRTYVGKKYRIIYSICEECREKNYKRFNQCPDCEEKPDKSIILWDVNKREVIYE